ncbi:hypothetical protein [Canicola haemoglobinophilus]|nr:hypothetical protein [Canicola haemoglobinophilus]
MRSFLEYRFAELATRLASHNPERTQAGLPVVKRTLQLLVNLKAY